MTEDDQRGTVKPEGSIEDRRPVPKWLIPVLVGTGVVAVIIASVFVALSLKNSYDISQQAKGRKASTQVFCGIADSIVEQVQILLISSSTLLRGDTLEGLTASQIKQVLIKDPPREVAGLYRPGKVSKNLNFDGRQDFIQRLVTSRAAAQEFGQKIADRVAEEARVQRQKIPPGSTGIRCNVILQVAQVQAPTVAKPTKK